jgi:T5SS/PEP-CTERM-associated repeat protein
MRRILLAFALSCACPAAFAAPAYKGMSYTSFNETDLSSAASDQSLTNMSILGTNTVALNFWWYQSDVHANSMAAIPGRSSSIASIQHAIDTIHGLGMKVLLKPMLDVSDANSTWRAYINPSSPDTWFQNYTSFINTFADLAMTNKDTVTALSIGCELNNMENAANDGRWINLIDSVRTHYTGTLTYSANWSGANFSTVDNFDVGGGYNTIGWWNHLDNIGIDAYFPIGSNNNPTQSQLEASWNSKANQINTFRTQNNLTDKHVVFTETGYSSYDGTAQTPFDGASPKHTSAAIDEQEQADAYQAQLNVMSTKDWWDGSFWWNWETSPSNDSANSYSPQNKLVQNVLASNYGGTFPPLPVSNWTTTSANASFSTASNWSGGVPNQNFSALFNRGAAATYTVTLSSNRTFDQLRVGSNAVTFQSSSTTTARTMTADDWRTSEVGRGIIVGLTNGDNGVVNVVKNGTADAVTLTARAATIGDAAGAAGTFNMTSNSTGTANVFNIIGSSAADTELIVGRAGTGTLNVTGGAHVNVNGANGNATLGQEAGSNGVVMVSGSGSSLTVTGKLQVGLAGSATLTLDSGGTVTASQVTIGALGKWQGNGTIIGNVLNSGLVSPGASVGTLMVSGGDFNQDANGKLHIELASASSFDSLQSTSGSQIDGSLEVALLAGFSPSVGDSFEVMHFNGGIFGTFAQTTLPTLGSNLSWMVNYAGNAVVLSVTSILAGDYNHNGIVDAADYTMWRDTFGQTVVAGTGADSDGDGIIGQTDYDFWVLHFGETVGSLPGAGAGAAVPEPATILLALIATIFFGCRARFAADYCG